MERLSQPPPAIGHVYALTAHGRTLEPLVLSLGAFGARYMDTPAPDEAVNPRWAMLSVKWRYAGSSSAGRAQFLWGEQGLVRERDAPVCSGGNP